MPYERFMEECLFKPLGMTDTTFWPDAEQMRRLAKSYAAGKNRLREVPLNSLIYPLDDRKRQPVPAAGLFPLRAI
jgi:CubicO group peptidase (beta-lactamase class C family)